MASDIPKRQRLYVDGDLGAGGDVVLDQQQAHYLINVLRLRASSQILLFNGRDGEWLAELSDVRKKQVVVTATEQVRAQTKAPTVRYLFAPLKRARLDYVVQKAVEMGAGHIQPIITHRTVAERVNRERMQANAIEAAEQCGILSIPQIAAPVSLLDALAAWDPAETLVFCDEAAPIGDPLVALKAMNARRPGVLIGPEGGFTDEERSNLYRQPFAIPISLGPRIMRADTAAVAALTVVNLATNGWC